MTTLGVVGCGTIATAVIRGIGRSPAAKAHVSNVVVNPRNAGNAKSLADEFPGWVTIAADSQAVLDAADAIFIGIHHKRAAEELPKLKFNAGRHSVISLMAIHPTATLSQLCCLPLKDVYRAQPLPSVAKLRGITILLSGTPDSPRAALFTELFDALGRCLRVKDDEQVKILFSTGFMMGPFYLQLKTIRDWFQSKGVDPVLASEMVGWTFNGIVGDAKDLCSDAHGFDDLIAEQTPGGLNEKAIDLIGPTLEDAYRKALEMVYDAQGPPKPKL